MTPQTTTALSLLSTLMRASTAINRRVNCHLALLVNGGANGMEKRATYFEKLTNIFEIHSCKNV